MIYFLLCSVTSMIFDLDLKYDVVIYDLEYYLPRKITTVYYSFARIIFLSMYGIIFFLQCRHWAHLFEFALGPPKLEDRRWFHNSKESNSFAARFCHIA